MNKILVNNETNNFTLEEDYYIFKNDGNYLLEVNNLNKDIYLVVDENVNTDINLLSSKCSINFHIKLMKNSKLFLHNLLFEGNTKFSISLEGENSEILLDYSLIGESDSYNKIEVYHLANKTVSNLKNHGYSVSGNSIVFDVNSYIPKESSKCVSHQDNQIIEKKSGLSQINPNLYIENYDVEASHSAYVGEFKEQELFYLMSRGIAREDCEFLLLKAFLIGSFSISSDIKDSYIEKINTFFK